MDTIVLYLMNKKGLEVLKKVVEKYTTEIIEYVVLSKDLAVEKDYYKDLIDFCMIKDIKNFNKNDDLPEFRGYKFAIGWRWIISDHEKLIVFHDSILPKYRGFSPLVNMLINGEEEIGVTSFFANQEYDRGDIILQNSIKINYPIKIQEAIELISKLYQNNVCEIIDKIINNENIASIRQDESEATYCVWRDEEDYLIDWSKDSNYIKRSVDALSFPYKGAKTTLNGEYIIIEDSEIIEDVIIENRDPGKIIFFQNGCPIVICGKGLLKITRAININGELISDIKFKTRFGR